MVKVKEDVLARYGSEWRKKLTNREGTVLSVFTPLGSNRERARVRWLKRNNRGREFEDIAYTEDLEVLL